jgi:hypothetical protein
MNIDGLSEKDILAIAAPEKLFTGDEEAARLEYRKLAMRWHPDRHGDAAVFAHINKLYETALRKLKDGVWQTPGRLLIKGKDGKEYSVLYRQHHSFELGDMYVGDSIVTYVVENQYSDLVHSAIAQLGNMKYANSAMRAEVNRYLPQVAEHVEINGSTVVALHKEPDHLLLRDVLQHFGGKLDQRHVAWILSCLYNLRCYLEWAGLAHNDLSPDTYFVAPIRHTGVLMGGWWYAARFGDKMKALPKRTLTYIPRPVLDSKVAHPITDSELVRATGRELLGDIVGTSLVTMVDLPKAMLQWLRGAGMESAVTEYETWSNKVLIDSFGARRYVKLDVSASDLYK